MKTYNIFLLLLLCSITGSVAQPSTADSLKLQELGMAYYNIGKLSCPSCQAESYSIFSRYAEEGDAQCMYQLYRCFSKGWGTKQDFSKALFWLQKAADKSHQTAIKELVLAFKDGRFGAEQNLSLACQYAIRLSELNNSTGHYQYGYMLYKGLGCTQNYEKAMECFEKAALQGHGSSMYMLGLCYRNGYGVPANRDIARSWLIKAAEKGVRAAREELEIPMAETEGSTMATRSFSAGNPVPETFRKVEHQMIIGMSGCYSGTLVTYDYSGKHVVSQKPLSMEINITGDEADICWTEEDKEPVTLHGISCDSLLVFNKATYHRSDHYSRSTPISWEFVSSAMTAETKNGKTMLYGNLQQFSPEVKEMEKPMYFVAEKTSEITPHKGSNEALNFHVTPNPFRDVIHVSFVLTQSAECFLRLYSANGILVMDKTLGTLKEGNHNVELTPEIVPGTYVLRLSCGNTMCVSTLFKENQ